MKEKVACKWKEGMAFEADVSGFSVRMDADGTFGGKGKGPRAKPIVLAALAGCTGMDVISLLNKMRVFPEYFNVDVEAELTEEHPKYYHKIHLIYEFRGKDLPLDKIEKAISLSRERYCGVSAMLSKSAEITHEVRILD